MRYCIVLAIGFLLVTTGCTTGGRYAVTECVVSRTAAGDLYTRAEQTDYAETSRYDETVAFCHRLEQLSPLVRLTSFGTSAQGRMLPLVIVSRGREFTPQGAGRCGKVLVLVQCCIHAGECEGKDATLALVRDLVVRKWRPELLAHVNLLVIPIFNVDGHERFGPYNRPNQNGPRETGWRATATNLNLNRDYLKADSPEMRAWLRLWVTWNPDLLIDTHTTNGDENRYDVFYSVTTDAVADPLVANWCETTLVPAIVRGLEADGYGVFEYAFARDPFDLEKGFNATLVFGPGYSTGYAALCNRPAILVETNARRPYRVRVQATYRLLVRLLEELNRDAQGLQRLVREADARCSELRGAGPDGCVVLRQRLTDDYEPVTYRGFESRARESEISGARVIEYGPQPKDIPTRLYRRAEAAASVTPAAAYVIPAQWQEAIWRLRLHGVQYLELSEPVEAEVEVYRLDDVKFAPRPHEGRFAAQYATSTSKVTMQFPAGSAVVPTNQPRAKVIAHLLEPQAPESLVAWGFFNAVFEQKEYIETYILEPLARQMLDENPALREEFRRRLESDAQFAQSPSERLRFFYRRLPFWDDCIGLYPVARVVDEDTLKRLLGSAAHPRAGGRAR